MSPEVELLPFHIVQLSTQPEELRERIMLLCAQMNLAAALHDFHHIKEAGEAQM